MSESDHQQPASGAPGSSGEPIATQAIEFASTDSGEELERAGYQVSSSLLAFDRDQLGLVSGPMAKGAREYPRLKIQRGRRRKFTLCLAYGHVNGIFAIVVRDVVGGEVTCQSDEAGK